MSILSNLIPLIIILILVCLSGRVRLARHATSHKMAAVKILTLHPNLSSRASSLTSAGSKAEKLMLTAEREIAVMKVTPTFSRCLPINAS